MTPITVRLRATAVLLVLFILAACSSPPRSEPTASNEVGIAGGWDVVRRVTDNEAGVVCWYYNGYQKGGISCLPIGETRLAPTE